MAGLIYRRIFEDWATLDECLACRRPPSLADMRRRLFILERQTDTSRPDHFYKGYLDQRLGDVEGHCGMLLTILEDLAHDYLSIRAGKIFVKRERFGEWQHLLPFIAPLPIIAARLQSTRDWPDAMRNHDQARARVMGANLNHTALPSVWDPQLDELIRQEGLNEMHLHLNGSTELDKVWLAALRYPDGFFQEIRKVNGGEAVRELYEQIRPGLNAHQLYRYLRVARRLRGILTVAAFPYPGALPISLSNAYDAIRGVSATGAPPRWAEYGGRPLHALHPVLVHHLSDIQAEALWYMGIIRLLRENPQPAHALLFHAYLLILGLFGRLTVQQTHQFGFDQFQKFTLNGLREDSEKSYEDRFHQLNGPSGEDFDHLEGRLAPKKNRTETERLLDTVSRGYELFRKKRDKSNRPMRLVARIS